MGTCVIGSANSSSAAPMSSARTTPPSDSPRLISQLRIGEASTSLR